MNITFLIEIVFLTIVFSHIAKKNFGVVWAYGIQSFAIVLILFNAFLQTGSLSLLLITVLAFTVKVVLAQIFFIRLIQKHELKFLVTTYLNMPLTLIVIGVLTSIAHSEKFISLTSIIPANQALSAIAFSSMFLSLFLIINRKGALSQIIGILSFENSIVAFAVFSGLEQSPTLQMGIIFDIFIWLIIATVFISMLYKHFGSLDVTSMTSLKE